MFLSLISFIRDKISGYECINSGSHPIYVIPLMKIPEKYHEYPTLYFIDGYYTLSGLTNSSTGFVKQLLPLFNKNQEPLDFIKHEQTSLYNVGADLQREERDLKKVDNPDSKKIDEIKQKIKKIQQDYKNIKQKIEEEKQAVWNKNLNVLEQIVAVINGPLVVLEGTMEILNPTRPVRPVY